MTGKRGCSSSMGADWLGRKARQREVFVTERLHEDLFPVEEKYRLWVVHKQNKTTDQQTQRIIE